MGKEMPAEISDDMLGHPGRQITVSHGTETLQYDQSQEKRNQLGHSSAVALHRDDVPQPSSQTQQSQINRGNRHNQESGAEHTGEVWLQKWQEPLERRHDDRILEEAGRENQCEQRRKPMV